MQILAFAGSSSKHSINKKLVTYVSGLFKGHDVNLIDLNDFEMPIFSVDKEAEQGIPKEAYAFSRHIAQADLILMSMAEHNGAYSAAFKNIFDWVSRIPNVKVFQEKPIFLMATSTGARGGASVLKIAEARFPRNGGQVIETFSLPTFEENFDESKGLTNGLIQNELNDKIEAVLSCLSTS
ncbi:NAD(P)H-dependent oxidoreductase [Marinilongibacter aquaticus]|uniref:NADPH-dependent FMN reductase n=1 Tax=Marinilongibacter aquaticus TaxID=2975157 RepID=UPI0021BD5805|nr:NAD(P)H-dependent oxidoreductase [Marinilongibacter aquaticus]UBM58918.1 NAD(P)H-dependent oxidoreductase [Marinilongibacter aquaticus]